MRSLLALLALGFLVVLHELGHLLGARALGLRVVRFALGFGPPLLSFRPRGVQVTLGAVPLGASVDIPAMNPHGAEAMGARAASPGRRLWVLLAGPLTNYLFALAVLTALYARGTHVAVPLTVGTVEPGSPAARGQLVPGDVLRAVDGEPLTRWSDLVDRVADSPGRALALEVERGGERRLLTVTPRADERGDGRLGLAQQYVYRSHAPLDALARAVAHTWHVVRDGVELGWRLVRGRPQGEHASPAGVLRQAAETAEEGEASALRVLGSISVLLAVFYLLPLPALDGGRALFALVEALTGRRVSPRAETLLHGVGFAALAVAIVAVAVADTRRLLRPPRAPEPARPQAAPRPANPPPDVPAPDAGPLPPASRTPAP